LLNTVILPRRWQLKTSIAALEDMLESGKGLTGKPLSATRKKSIEREVAQLRAQLKELNPPANLPVENRFRISVPREGEIAACRTKELAFEEAQTEANRRGIPVHVFDSFQKNAQIILVAPQIVKKS
jgi:hypothetical protein